jgi:predicted metal-dependent phosphoesterase TrpH
VTKRSLGIVLAALAAAVLLPPVLEPLDVPVMRVDANGVDAPCPPDFATATRPDRSRATPRALLDDLAWAAAAAGPEGCAALLVLTAALVLLLSLWSHGVRCALRRVLVTFALGLPLCVGLFYASCFLEGLDIRLGPAAKAEGLVPCSLHTQTNRTTGLLSPAHLVAWHLRRGFRVLNVSDKDAVHGALEAVEHARGTGLLVVVGEEWHGHPHLLLVGVRRAWKPEEVDGGGTIEGVRAEGGAVFVAHPWSKLEGRLEAVLELGADGAEVVNGVVHGGRHVIESALRAEKALIGVVDYKYGPHVTAVTLLPERAAESAAGVVQALRDRKAEVVYAVPGGAVTGAEWDAASLARPAWSGLRTLLETPRPRRAVWFAWLAGAAVLWWIASRPREGRRMGKGTARILLAASAVVELVLPATLGWQFREAFGTIPVPTLLGVAAVAAVPLLGASMVLARTERERA